MKLGTVTDVHLGNHRRFGGETVGGLNHRCLMTMETLALAAKKARELKVDALVIGGDLFDTSRPEPQIIAAAQKALGDTPTVIMLGNHDQVSSERGDHALGPMDPISNVVTEPTVIELGDGELWAVPFRPGRAADWLPTVMAEVQGTVRAPKRGSPASPPRVLALHLGLSDGDTPPWLKDAHDSVPASLVAELAKKYDMSFVVAGNWHDHKVWVTADVTVVQCGTLCPTGFDNPGLRGYGSLVVYDSVVGGFTRYEIPGPRFIKLTWPKAVLETAPGMKVFVEVTAKREDLKDARAWVDDGVKDGILAGGEVVADSTEVQIAVRAAAQEAKSAGSLDEALVSFVKEMPLDDGVDRAAVLARAKCYLGGAG